MVRSKIFVGSLVAATTFSAFILSSTTVKADTYTKTARIQVTSACTLTGNVATPHSRNVAIATYEYDIGETDFSAVCNDSGGFAVYAIGFTGDTDGNNKLVHSTNSSIYINTGLAESGNTSAWAMKLTAIENAATPTIHNGYSNYSLVPDDYVKVASYPSTTTAAASSMFKSYYAAYVSPTQSAGIYNGKVKYVMVHPTSAAAPEKEVPETVPYIDSDPDISKASTHSDGTVFAAGSLSRAFEIAYYNAGSAMYINDASATATSGWRKMTSSDDITGKQLRFAMQDIGLTLDGQVTGTKICDAATVSASDNSYINSVSLIDLRDGKTYQVVKAADGKCWMGDNLELDLVATSLSTLQGKTNASDATLSILKGVTTGSSPYATTGVDYYEYIAVADANFTRPFIYAVDPNVVPSGTNYGNGGNRVGIYYNFCAASAGSFCWDHSGSVSYATEDICPSDWRLPTGGNTSEQKTLYQTAYNHNMVNIRTALSLPNAGWIYYNTDYWAVNVVSRGDVAYFWSSTSSSNDSMYTLSTSVYSPTDGYGRGNGLSIRCVAK